MKLLSGAYAEVFVEGDEVLKIARPVALPPEGTRPEWAATGVGFFTGSVGAFRPEPNDVLDGELAMLRAHAAFVRVRSSGTLDGRRWMRLDYVRGGSLRERPIADLRPLVELALSLEQAGLRHGDLKPDNVLHGATGLVLIDPTSGIGTPDSGLLATEAYNPLFEPSDVPALASMLAEAEIGRTLASFRGGPFLPLGESAVAWRDAMRRVGRGRLADALLSLPRPLDVGCTSDLAWEGLGLRAVNGRIEKIARIPTVAQLAHALAPS